jgi:hypothetical protein
LAVRNRSHKESRPLWATFTLNERRLERKLGHLVLGLVNMKAAVRIEGGGNDTLGLKVEKVPLSRLAAYFLRLGTIGFGGPVALVGYMQRDLVEERGWVSNDDYLQGLAFSQLSPGPLAAQLANYLGWVHSGIPGATLTGIAFVLPSFLMVLALAAVYVHFGQLAWIKGMAPL